MTNTHDISNIGRNNRSFYAENLYNARQVLKEDVTFLGPLLALVVTTFDAYNSETRAARAILSIDLDYVLYATLACWLTSM
jgi:hypothetical protein